MMSPWGLGARGSQKPHNWPRIARDFWLFAVTGIVLLALSNAQDAGNEAKTVADSNARLVRKLTDTQIQLGATQAQLVSAAHTFAVSQKASTKTRVSTVSQRCDLTGLILRVLVRVHDQVDAEPFERSEAKCLRQLATVKQINAQTPSPATP